MAKVLQFDGAESRRRTNRSELARTNRRLLAKWEKAKRVEFPANLGTMLASVEQLDEFLALTQSYYDQGAIIDVEEMIRQCVDGFREKGADRERAFSESVFLGLMKVAATLQAQIRGSMHFQSNRHREIEDRLSALEHREVAADAIAVLETRIKSLETEREENPPFKYFGQWTELEYEKNNTVTHGGSLWIAKRRTKSKPEVNTGAAEMDWQLACKRGRDGKDAK